MYLRTQYMQATLALIEQLLGDVVSPSCSGIVPINSTLQLYLAGPVPSRYNLLSSFPTLASFPGYAPVTITSKIGPFNLPGGQGVGGSASWIATGPTSPAQAVLGVLLVAPDGTTLLAQEQFADQVPFSLLGDSLEYDLILAPKSLWGGEQGA